MKCTDLSFLQPDLLSQLGFDYSWTNSFAFCWRNSNHLWKTQSIKIQIQFIFSLLTSVTLDYTLTILDNERTEEEMFIYHILESKCTRNQIIIVGFFSFWVFFLICAHRMKTRNWRLLLLLLELHNLLEKPEKGEDLRGLYGMRFLADGMHNAVPFCEQMWNLCQEP